jgi:hypothetical protein
VTPSLLWSALAKLDPVQLALLMLWVLGWLWNISSICAVFSRALLRLRNLRRFRALSPVSPCLLYDASHRSSVAVEMPTSEQNVDCEPPVDL